jgi:hypothetical protein
MGEYIDQKTDFEGLEYSSWIDFVKDLENTHLKGGRVILSSANLMKISGLQWGAVSALVLDKFRGLGFTVEVHLDPALYGEIVVFKKSNNEESKREQKETGGANPKLIE